MDDQTGSLRDHVLQNFYVLGGLLNIITQILMTLQAQVCQRMDSYSNGQG